MEINISRIYALFFSNSSGRKTIFKEINICLLTNNFIFANIFIKVIKENTICIGHWN